MDLHRIVLPVLFLHAVQDRVKGIRSAFGILLEDVLAHVGAAAGFERARDVQSRNKRQALQDRVGQPRGHPGGLCRIVPGSGTLRVRCRLELFGRQVVGNHLFQLDAVDRFGQVIGKSFLYIHLPRTGNRIGGQGNRRDAPAGVRLQLLQGMQGFYAVHRRHHVVYEEHVVVLCGTELEGFQPAGRRVYLHFRFLEQALEDRQVHRSVVHTEDLCVRGGEACPVV